MTPAPEALDLPGNLGPHTAASIGFAEGLDPKMIQAMLGHSIIGVTMDTYTHLIPALKKEGAERIGKALEG